jgi:hypothetical protein
MGGDDEDAPPGQHRGEAHSRMGSKLKDHGDALDAEIQPLTILRSYRKMLLTVVHGLRGQGQGSHIPRCPSRAIVA